MTQVSSYMRALRDRCGLTVDQFIFEISKHHPNEISLDTVNSWLNADKPVSFRYRKAFFTFLQKALPADEANTWEQEFIDLWQAYAAETQNHDAVFRKHHKWINQRYNRPLMGEDFPLSSIYVPIKLTAYGMRTGIEELDQVFSEDDLVDFAKQGFIKSNRKADKDVDWVFIKGGPGSGKSALAITIAARLSKKKTMATVFLRGSHLTAEKNTEIPTNTKYLDDSIHLRDFFANFIKSSKKKMTLIIDGLDEIGTVNIRNEQSILDIVEEIRQQSALLTSHDKTFRALVFGRETLTEIAAKSFKSNIRLFEMGDLSGALGHSRMTSHCYDIDRRGEWWAKYAIAKSLETGEAVPQFLTDQTHGLHEISREPLLIFLIIRTAWPISNSDQPNSLQKVVEAINAYAENKNRNEIYEDIINRVRHGHEWKEDVRDSPTPVDFLRVLRHMALATWHNGTFKAVTIKGIKEVIHDDRTSQAFERMLVELGQESDASLLTAFYYRFEERAFEAGQSSHIDDFEIEFTHKTFAEYLVTTLLFDGFEQILSDSIYNVSDAQRAQNQQHFVSQVMAGAHSKEIMKFALDEVRIRYANRPWREWQKATRLVTEIQCLKDVNPASDEHWVSQVSTRDRLQHASQVMMLFCGCLNRVRYEQTEVRTEYDENEYGFESYELQLLASAYTLGQFVDGVEMGDTGPESFLTAAFSGVKWAEADFPGLYLCGGELFGSEFKDCVFEGLVWNDVEIQSVEFNGSSLRRGKFQNTYFDKASLNSCWLHQSRLHDSFFQESSLRDVRFDQSEFLHVHFVECEIRGMSFCRSDFKECEFVNCKFVGCDFEAVLFDDTVFENCTFEGLQTEDSQFSQATFKNCSGHETNV